MEELVRGVRFRGLSTPSFKDIVAASDESYVFAFIDSNAPFALMGAGSFITNASVIAPAVLFDELELEPIQEDLPRPPIVPAPPLSRAPALRHTHSLTVVAQRTERRVSPRVSLSFLPRSAL